MFELSKGTLVKLKDPVDCKRKADWPNYVQEMFQTPRDNTYKITDVIYDDESGDYGYELDKSSFTWRGDWIEPIDNDWSDYDWSDLL